MFRTPEEAVEELIREIRSVKDGLREISGRVTQIESRVKRAFPTAAAKSQVSSKVSAKVTDPPSISRDDALMLYDELVAMAKEGKKDQVQQRLNNLALPDLALLSRELGVSLGRKKPSRNPLVAGVLGRLNESVLLMSSSRQRLSAEPSAENTPREPDKSSGDKSEPK